MPCCICNNYLMCVPIKRRSVEDPIVQNLEKCCLMKVLGYRKGNFLCNECVFAVEKCAERIELMLFKRTLFTSEVKKTKAIRCLICATYYRVEIFKISEADSKNYVIKELLGQFVSYDQLIYACVSCIRLIDQLDQLTVQYFKTESEYSTINANNN